MIKLNILFSLFLIILNSFSSSLGALAFKKSANTKNPWKYIIYGCCAYFFSSITLIIALKYIHLGIAIPLTSITYLWTQFFACKYLGETITKKQKIGLTLIAIGIIFLALASF